jgi:release factor glutamine methyltransferase
MPMWRTASVSRVIDRAQAIYTADPPIVAVVEDLTRTLRLAGIADPRRVATDILAALLEVPRSWPLMNRDASVAVAIVAAAHRAAGKLCRGAPFAYAVGSQPFRHLTLAVDDRVLIPRPETEVLVGEVLDRMKSRFGSGSWGTAVDIGTGSGAIALSLACEGSFDNVIATDISADALGLARENRDRNSAVLGAPVEFRYGSLIAPVRGVVARAVVSNPPYIAFSEIEALPASVRDWEPSLALVSGHDGMTATAAIVRDAHGILAEGGLLALEVDERRASLVADLAMRHGGYSDVGVRLDLAGRERFVLATRT